MTGPAVFALGVLLAAPAAPDQLRVQFIDNMAFHVSDGRTSLLTDFPDGQPTRAMSRHSDA